MARSLSVLCLAGVIGACASAPIRSGPVIDHFSQAACVPAGRVENVYPPGWLAWDYVVQTLRDPLIFQVGEITHEFAILE